MKLASLAALCCLLLSGCVVDPSFDTSDWNAYQQSLGTVKSKLNNDELRRLDVALKYLLFEGVPVGSELVPDNVMFRVGATNPNSVLRRLAPRIDGRTAAAVVRDLANRLDTEISEAEAVLQSGGAALKSVEIGSPRYYWRRSGFVEQPVIEFSIFNGSKTSISRVYLNGVLTTPNRSIPWVKQSFSRTFRGGLEPRERLQVTLDPNSGGWNDRQLKDVYNADLKIVVTNFEDANGQKAIAVDSDQLDFKRRVRAALN
jgi:hypothetical protein